MNDYKIRKKNKYLKKKLKQRRKQNIIDSMLVLLHIISFVSIYLYLPYL